MTPRRRFERKLDRISFETQNVLNLLLAEHQRVLRVVRRRKYVGPDSILNAKERAHNRVCDDILRALKKGKP